MLGRDEVYTSDALVDAGCWLVVDDDDLGEVKVMRDYSQWDGVPHAAHACGTCRCPKSGGLDDHLNTASSWTGVLTVDRGSQRER